MHDLVSLYAAIHENPMDALTWAALADVKEERGADPTIPRSVVEDSVFCGKRVGIAVYVHPTDLHYFVEM